MLTAYSEKPIKGVAASEVPEVSLLYACIDLHSHSEQILARPSKCRINTKKNACYCQLSRLDTNSAACSAQIVHTQINEGNSGDKNIHLNKGMCLA